jgi:hypothetical protein
MGEGEIGRWGDLKDKGMGAEEFLISNLQPLTSNFQLLTRTRDAERDEGRLKRTKRHGDGTKD